MAIDWRAVGPHSACLTTLSRVNLKHMFGMKIWWEKKTEKTIHMVQTVFQRFGLIQHFHRNPSRGADPNFTRQLAFQPNASTNQLEILESFELRFNTSDLAVESWKLQRGKMGMWMMWTEETIYKNWMSLIVQTCGCWVFSWHAHTKGSNAVASLRPKNLHCERKMKGVKFGGPQTGIL